MRKFLAILVAAALALALMLPAAAADPITPSGATSMDITAEYVPGTAVKGDTVYAVTLTWDAITNLKYQGEGSVYKWNAEQHRYEKVSGGTDAGWTKDSTSLKLTVENDSDAQIKASVSVASAASGLSVSCTGAGWSANSYSATLASAAAGIGADFSGTGATVTKVITGTIAVTGDISNTGKVAAVTVQIEKVDA